MKGARLPHYLSPHFELTSSSYIDIGGYKGFVLVLRCKDRPFPEDIGAQSFSRVFSKTLGVQLVQREEDLCRKYRVYIVAEK